jgi:hypothetical protein
MFFYTLQSQSRHVEFYLRWCWEILKRFGPTIQLDAQHAMSHREVLRNLVRAVALHEREALKMSDENHFNLKFICSQLENLDTTQKKNGILMLNENKKIDSLLLEENEEENVKVEEVKQVVVEAVLEDDILRDNRRTEIKRKSNKKSKNNKEIDQVPLMKKSKKI